MNIYTPWKSLEELYYGNPHPLEESIDESEEEYYTSEEESSDEDYSSDDD